MAAENNNAESRSDETASRNNSASEHLNSDDNTSVPVENAVLYKDLFKNMNEGFSLNRILCDDEGRPSDYIFLDVNPSFERLTGLKREDVVGKRVKEVLPGIEHYWIERFGNVALTGESCRFENFSSNLNRWYEVYSYRPAKNIFAIIFTDSTERKLADEQLIEIARFPLENPFPVMRVRIDGTILFSNPSSRMLTHKWNNTSNGSAPEGWKLAIMRAYESREMQILEEKIDGRHFSFNIVPVDRTDFVNIYGSDITRLREAQDALNKHKDLLEEQVAIRTMELSKAYEELRAKQTRLAEAQRIGRIGNWEWDIVGNKLIWSDETYRIFGIQPDGFEATYDAFIEAVHPDDREMVIAAVNAALAMKTQYSVDHRILLPDGEVRVAHEQAEVFLHNGSPFRMAGTVQDITEKKRAEIELLEREKQLETLSRAMITAQEAERESVCQDLHDELGQRLMALGMGINWLERQEIIAREDVARLGETLENINAELQRIYRGLKPAALDKLGLEAAVQSMLWDYRDRYGFDVQKSIDKSACATDRPRSIAIYRILQEALTNIARHSGAKLIEVVIKKEAGQIIMSIEDDGSGFDPAEAVKKGGMGLLGMKERAALIGGEIDIVSRVGGGARVTLRVAASENEEES